MKDEIKDSKGIESLQNRLSQQSSKKVNDKELKQRMLSMDKNLLSHGSISRNSKMVIAAISSNNLLRPTQQISSNNSMKLENESSSSEDELKIIEKEVDIFSAPKRVAHRPIPRMNESPQRQNPLFGSSRVQSAATSSVQCLNSPSSSNFSGLNNFGPRKRGRISPPNPNPRLYSDSYGVKTVTERAGGGIIKRRRIPSELVHEACPLCLQPFANNLLPAHIKYCGMSTKQMKQMYGDERSHVDEWEGDPAPIKSKRSHSKGHVLGGDSGSLKKAREAITKETTRIIKNEPIVIIEEEEDDDVIEIKDDCKCPICFQEIIPERYLDHCSTCEDYQ